MSNNYNTLNDLFTGIANSIRLKNGTTEDIIADTFPTAIRELRTGFDYNNQNVTVIEDYQFRNCTDLKSVDCYSVESIGVSAFEGCSNLESIVLYEGVQSIGENAFKGCSNLTIYCIFENKPDTWDDNWNPDNCDVVYLSEAVETWDISATESDNVIAKLYNDIHNEGMYSLIISGNGNMKDFDDYTNPSPQNGAAPWCYNSEYRIKIVNVFISKGVYNIGCYMCFKCSSLTSVNIPKGVTNIRNSAFKGCTSLTEIIIPNSVTKIDDYTFSGCTSLTEITIPNSVTEIGSYIFSGCDNLTIYCMFSSQPDTWDENWNPDNCKVVWCGVIETWDISATENDNVIAKLYNDVNNEGMYSLIISGKGKMKDFSSPSSIAWSSYERNITSITIPSSVTSIGSYAFYKCSSLTSIAIPNSVTSIGHYAFGYCTSLTEITIPNSVTSIDSYAFSNCTSLESATIPDSVTSIGNNAFYFCKNLKIINITDLYSWCNIEFGSSLYYSSFNLYLNGEPIKDLIVPDGITSIRNYAFYECILSSVNIPDSVTSIGRYAFARSLLKSITIPNSVTSIGDSAFWGCIYLKSVIIPNSVTSIEDRAFGGCDVLTSVILPDGLTEINDLVFEGCIYLTSLNIPNSVTSINYSAFRGCKRLTTITIPDSVTSIGSMAFSNCTSLESVIISESVISIGSSAFDNTAYYNNSLNWENDVLYIDNALIEAKTTISGDYVIKDGTTIIADYAFSGCTSLESITILDSVTSIGSYAFRKCSSFTSITIPNSVKSIGNSAFYGCEFLKSINYTGTVAQWVITLGDYWNNNTPDYTIYCTDGTISKDGTITYYNATSGGES